MNKKTSKKNIFPFQLRCVLFEIFINFLNKIYRIQIIVVPLHPKQVRFTLRWFFIVLDLIARKCPGFSEENPFLFVRANRNHL